MASAPSMAVCLKRPTRSSGSDRNASTATIDASGRSDGTLNLGNSKVQTLNGIGTINGSLSEAANSFVRVRSECQHGDDRCFRPQRRHAQLGQLKGSNLEWHRHHQWQSV